jgi:hypothetical protein
VNGAQLGHKPKTICERKINRKIRFELKWGKDLLGLSAEALSSSIIGLLRAPLRFGLPSLPLALSLWQSSPSHPAAIFTHSLSPTESHSSHLHIVSRPLLYSVTILFTGEDVAGGT